MKSLIRPSITILITLALVTGIIYPFLITGLAQAIYPRQANGSLIQKTGQTVGSQLIGQQFDDPKYFWGRLSDTSGTPYNASSSGGSNYSALNPDLQAQIKARIAALKAVDPNNTQPIPVDLVTASGSGLDPNISVASAEYQAARVAKYRGLSLDQVNALIKEYTNRRVLGFLGEQTVNVLELNLALDGIK